MSQNLQLEGIAAAPGIVIAPAFKLRREEWVIPKQKISQTDIPLQIQLFEEALINTVGDSGSTEEDF